MPPLFFFEVYTVQYQGGMGRVKIAVFQILAPLFQLIFLTEIHDSKMYQIAFKKKKKKL